MAAVTGIARMRPAGPDPRLARLRRVVRTALQDPACEVVGVEPLERRALRLHLAAHTGARTVVAKRLDPLQARRTEQLAGRWLPACDLAANGPGLLGASATSHGRWVWHLYQDLGPASLVGREADAAAVEAVVHLVARLHSRFAAHPLLAEVRPFGSFDISYYRANLIDALRALAALAGAGLSAEQAALRDRLAARLQRLLADAPRRARALEAWGGPETLLHGDLWTSNAFALRTASGVEPRLIDWDRAGVGPMSHDLSAFLLRFPRPQRPRLVELYAGALENEAWRLPSPPRLNLLFETAELARYANRVIWPAIAIARDRAAWGFPELAAVEGWFEALEPVLPS